MGIKKGDLVKVNLPSTETMTNLDIQQELFSSLVNLKTTDILIAVSSPYEFEMPTIQQTNSRGRMFVCNSLMVCVDLLLDNEIYKAVPIKYLERT